MPKRLQARHRSSFPTVVLPLLSTWREQNKNAPEDAMNFPSKAGKAGYCIRPENWLHRRVHPVAKALGIPAANFQILRRTFATNAQSGNLKGRANPLVQSTVGTTANVYVQAISESVRKLVSAVAEDVMSAKPVTERGSENSECFQHKCTHNCRLCSLRY